MEEVVPQYLLDDFKRFFRVSRTTFETICANTQEYRALLPSWTGSYTDFQATPHCVVVCFKPRNT